MIDPHASLLAEVEAFLKATGWSASKFGLEVINDSKLLPRLRRGGITYKTDKRVREFMAAHRTDGVA